MEHYNVNSYEEKIYIYKYYNKYYTELKLNYIYFLIFTNILNYII